MDPGTVGDGIAPVVRRGTRRRLVIAGAVGLVALLVAGLVAWVVWPDRPGRAPFERAVANLAAAEAVSYETSFAGLTARTSVTDQGDALGTVTLAGVELSLLTLDGQTFVKTADGGVPGLTTGSLGLGNRWIRSDTSAYGAQALYAMAPPALAERLEVLVEQATDFESASVADVDAYVARAPAGQLFVTRNEPHRVLRVEPPSGPVPGVPPPPQLPSLPDLTDLPEPPDIPELPDASDLPELPDLPPPPGNALHRSAVDTLAAWTGPAAQPAAPTGRPAPPPAPLEVSPVTPADTDHLYTDLVTNAAQLVDSVDPRVQFDAQVAGQISCGATCQVNVSVTNQLTGGADTTILSSQVTVTMTATISVDGRPAGVCSSPPTPVPVNGSGQVSCADAASGLLARTLLQQKRQAAAARGGGTVSVAVTAQVEAHATAMTQAEVRQEIDRLTRLREQARAGRPAPTYPDTGLRVGPVNLGTRQSGTTDPVPVDGLSTPWNLTVDRFTIEEALGGNLPPRTQAVDFYSAHDGGTAISIKSLDPRVDSYRDNPSQIRITGEGQVNDLVNFRRTLEQPNPRFAHVLPENVSVWVLRLAYPADTTDQRVLDRLQAVLKYGEEHGVIVQLVPIVG